jgi:hypothetical protein
MRLRTDPLTVHEEKKRKMGFKINVESLRTSLRKHVGCPRKRAHISNIFAEKISRARAGQFLPYETVTQKVAFPSTFSLFTALRTELDSLLLSPFMENKINCFAGTESMVMLRSSRYTISGHSVSCKMDWKRWAPLYGLQDHRT